MVIRQLCSCDEICLYVGDCCFDFVYQCMGGSDLEASLARQEQIISDFRKKTTCSSHYVSNKFTHGYFFSKVIDIPVISRCPSNTTKSLSALCDDYEEHNFLSLPQNPVIHQGIIYKNVYCSLCNSASPEKVRLLRYELINASNVQEPDGNTNRTSFAVLLTDIDGFKQIRYGLACNHHCKNSIFQCAEEVRDVECGAYQAPITAVFHNGSAKIFRNLACIKCGNTSIKEHICLTSSCYGTGQGGFLVKWTSLFDFVGKTKYTSSRKGASSCSSVRCQDGYMLNERSCTYCKQVNISHSPISVTWFQSSILLIFRSHDAADTARQMFGRKSVNTGQCCTNTTDWLQDIGFFNFSADTENMSHKSECLLLPISYLEVQFYTNIFQSNIFLEQVMPGLRNTLHTVYIFNFDVNYKPRCEQSMAVTAVPEDIMQGDGSKPDYMLQNYSYHPQPPRIFARSFVNVKEHGRVWKLLCVDEREDSFNCSYESMSDLNVCPKVEIHFTSKSEYEFQTKSGHFIKHNSKYILISNQTALICASQCKLGLNSDIKTLDILVPMCYSVSMLCLMITFIIYMVTPPLRNVPGLMLMNLIVALFLAQMSYLISSYGVFLNHPHWCQFLGATQHYFWLTTFAWMACITVDIYQCLSTIEVSHPDSHKERYYKLLVLCWLAPTILPTIALCLQFSGSMTVGYGGQHSCWLKNSRSVLYFFAIPALSIVIINVAVFLGSVYRIHQISKNSCYVGRKEDGKLRLIRCVKISSWIGGSWLFGILPNIINRPELWYVFTICNAFQGLQIFLAFGVSRRSRQLLCGNPYDDTNEPTIRSTSTTDF